MNDQVLEEHTVVPALERPWETEIASVMEEFYRTHVPPKGYQITFKWLDETPVVHVVKKG